MDTITAELQPYDTLIDKDLEQSLSSWVQERSIQEEKVLALLRDLIAELKEDKKRALCSDDLDEALVIKEAATVAAHLQSDSSSATDVLLGLSEYEGVISDEWYARIYSLVPSSGPECGPPSKRSRTT